MAVETLELPVKLTDPEVLQRADEAAKVTREMYEAEQKRKDTARDQKKVVDDMQLKLKKLARIVETKTEMRPVEVTWERDDARLMMLCIRTDTGEVARTRAMTDKELEERTGDLFSIPGGRRKKTDA